MLSTERGEGVAVIDPKLVELHDAAFGLPGTERAEWEAWFDEDVKRLVGLCVDDEARRAVEITSQNIKWKLFAQPGDPLPETLCIIKRDNGQYEVDQHPEYFVSIGAQQDVFKALTESSDTSAASAIYRQALNNQANTDDKEITYKFKEVIKGSNTYQFLESFKADPQALEDQPLSLADLVIRESQIEAEVRKRFNIQPGQSIVSRSPADNALQRALYQLDDETRPAKQVVDRSPADRLVDFVRNAYNQSDYLGDNNPISKLILDPTSLKYQDQDGAPVSTEAIHLVCLELTSQLDVPVAGFNNLPGHLKVLLYKVVAACASQSSSDYDQMLSDGLEFAVGDGLRFGDTTDISADLEWLRQPAGKIIPQTNYEEALDEYPTISRRLRLLEAQTPLVHESFDEHQTTLGVVEKRPADDTVQRLLISTGSINSIKEVPQGKGSDDLVLDFTRSNGHFGLDGFSVPGYDQVAFSKGLAARFTRSEHDPYQPSGIEVPTDRLAELLVDYEVLGLDGLVRDIKDTPNITVDQLAEAIRAHSDYTYDHNYSMQGWKIDSALDYSPIVVDGRLQLQCSGAASFFGTTLDTLFGKGSSQAIRGYVIPAADNRISWVSHAQTVLSYQGKSYIFDTTPPDALDRYETISGYARTLPAEAPLRRGWLRRFSRDRQKSPAPMTASSVEQEVSSLPDEDPVAKPALVEIEYVDEAEAAEEQAAVRVQTAKEALEMQLCGLLGVTNVDQMYKLLVELPQDDPLRRTMRLVATAARGEGDMEEVERTLAFVENYPEKGSPILKRHNLKAYDSTALSLAKRALSSL